MPGSAAAGMEDTVPRKRRGRPKKAVVPADPPPEIVDSEGQADAPDDQAEQTGNQAEDPEWEPAASMPAEAGAAEEPRQGQASSESDDGEKLSPTRKSSRRRRAKGAQAGSPAEDLDADDQAPDRLAEHGDAAEQELAVSPRKKLKGDPSILLSRTNTEEEAALTREQCLLGFNAFSHSKCPRSAGCLLML